MCIIFVIISFYYFKTVKIFLADKTAMKVQQRVQFKPGSARFKKIQDFLNPEMDLWSGLAHPPKPWTKLWSGLEKFRFELWQPYFISFSLAAGSATLQNINLYMFTWFVG